MTEINPDSAIRNFKIGAKQNQQINACPEDYCLVLLGTVDDETGSINPVDSVDGFPAILFKPKIYSRLNSFGTIREFSILLR